MSSYLQSRRRSIAIVALQFAGGVVGFGESTPATAPPEVIPAKEPVTPGLRVFDPSLIDNKVDPCENFYRYSCNGWLKRNPLPADQVAYGRYSELDELVRKQLREILGSCCGAIADANSK